MEIHVYIHTYTVVKLKKARCAGFMKVETGSQEHRAARATELHFIKASFRLREATRESAQIRDLRTTMLVADVDVHASRANFSKRRLSSIFA